MTQRSPTMEASNAKAPAVRNGWINMAVQFVRVAVGRGLLHRFTAGDVAALALRNDIPSPVDPRAWGQVLQRAKREGLIRPFEVLGRVVTKTSAARHRTTVWEPVRAAIPTLTDVAVPVDVDTINYDGPLPGEYR